MNPGKIVDPPKMDDARCSASRRATGRSRSSRRSTGRRGTCRTIRDRATRAGHRRRLDRRLRQGRRDVQQQRPLPQVRRRHDVPELSRHARRAAPDARPRQHAAAGAVRPARRRRFASDAVHEALDLCVRCKGCKRDCPTGVDMARMKIEFLAHYKARHGYSAARPADRATCRATRRGARAPGADLRNLRAALRCKRALLGFSAQRALPRWRARQLLATDAPRRRAADATVVLFVDTFNRYFEPENARAAMRVLRGRRLSRARRHAAAPAAVLRPHLPRRRPGRRGEARSAPAARGAAPFVDARRPDRRPRAVVPAFAARRVLRAGSARTRGAGAASASCSRNSSRASEGRPARASAEADARRCCCTATATRRRSTPCRAVQKVLRLVPGARRCRRSRSSCCGMAGSFGYEAEHYEVSMAMAELSLLPAVRKAAATRWSWPTAPAAATRSPTAPGARRLHVARVLEAALSAR